MTSPLRPLNDSILQEAWAFARDMSGWICRLFGDPRALVQTLLIPRDDARKLRQWLRPLEIMVRRLILCLAEQTPKPNDEAAVLNTPRPSSPSASPGKPGFASENPADWPVSFQLAPQPSRPARGQKQARRDLPRFVDARPLAERLEAALRALADPAPYARRLRRLLRRNRARVLQITVLVFGAPLNPAGPLSHALGVQSAIAFDRLCADTS
ncbi:MAG: hypothetical protein GC189_05300 [Alphaproteobacteria bacterium]|nr:hypothetical protein [Alphaproteobacteria bacterium]